MHLARTLADEDRPDLRFDQTELACVDGAGAVDRDAGLADTLAVTSFLVFFERRFLILAAVRLENHYQRCAALLFKQDEQLLHVLSAGSKVHGIDAEPGLALEFCRRYPEFFAPLDSLDYRAVQLLRIVFAQGAARKRMQTADMGGRLAASKS